MSYLEDLRVGGKEMFELRKKYGGVSTMYVSCTLPLLVTLLDREEPYRIVKACYGAATEIGRMMNLGSM